MPQVLFQSASERKEGNVIKTQTIYFCCQQTWIKDIERCYEDRREKISEDCWIGKNAKTEVILLSKIEVY